MTQASFMSEDEVIPFNEQTAPHAYPIRVRFLKFHEENPKVYIRLVELARELKQNFKLESASIGLLWERLRWISFIEVQRDPTKEQYKLNDHYRSEYAREIMARERDLKDFFEVRKLRRRS